MAPKSSSTANHTSQISTAAENTSQTSTTEEEKENARGVISQIAKEIPTLSDEQCRIIHEEIKGVLTLALIKQYFLQYQDISRTGSYTPAAFRDMVQKHLGSVTATVLDESVTILDQ
ncbi:hypothetical protein BDZ89DRAFT_1146526 [Hymenopellis radicata]|nr:hypothetical protein BDZ89DRAFT_1146526 [Hymenopellis radicata]